MTGADGRPRLDRRAVLGGLIAGAGTSLALSWRAAGAEDGARDVLTAPQAIEIKSRPILHFERGRPDAKRFGDLQFRGGLVLSSASSSFGGWSGLVVAEDGSSLLAVSDVGNWLMCDVAYQAERPTGLARARIGPLLSLRGQPLANKREQDAESIALLDGTLSRGTVLIGFERQHRIGRFEIRDGRVQKPSSYLKLPADARRMRENQGIEALAVLKAGPFKGSVVAFAERLTGGSGYHTGWIWVKGEPQRFQLQDIGEFNITDAAALPDGDLLALERRFRWSEGVKMRLRRIEMQEIAPGARIVGRTLLEADSSHEIDNMEGLAVHRGVRGETVVSLISDDNFNQPLQRTVFLQFTLLADGSKSTVR